MQQKTLSLLQFQKKFGTEKACQKQLFRLRWPEGFKCPRCGQMEAYFHSKRHLYQCKSCGYQASLTAGTVFHKTRTPLTLSLIHISEPTRRTPISYAVFCLKKKKNKHIKHH